ncbi:hypothetical protein CRG98_006689, partial [Punica granatum]
ESRRWRARQAARLTWDSTSGGDGGDRRAATAVEWRLSRQGGNYGGSAVRERGVHEYRIQPEPVGKDRTGTGTRPLG